ncbi:YceI family protein [Mucilaginibacter corticis]|uniref:YceI family protein n=1 Tax=Mucilaginibacter corticis TaxID=2597670 RepID=A0A556MS49_9SPHI|nr:YceI family protein [Mucilaginibacter corticis]TSJ42618.1 YceI family protein [Mucilaginibacter corticis]
MKKLLSITLLIASLASCRQNKTEVKYQVNENVSKALWKGSATDHFHIGSFKVTGNLNADLQGNVTGGNFTIPVLSIQDFDLTDPIRQTLLADLKSANFFNVAIHPNAEFKITKIDTCIKADTNAIAGANYLVTGNFSMVGQTHTLSFPAKISYIADSLRAEAKFNLDRTKWGMKIYSDPKQKLFIYPDVNIHLDVRAKKQARISPLAILAPNAIPVQQ